MPFAHPNGNQTTFPALTALHGGRWRATRRIEVRNQSQIVNDLFPAFDDADVTPTASANIFANLRLIDKRVLPGDKDGYLTLTYETLTGTFVDETAPVSDYEMNGLKRTPRQLIARPGTDTSAFVVGTQTYGTSPVQYLAAVKIEEAEGYTRVNATYIEAGIVDADKQFDAEAGLLYVTFVSVGVKFTPTCLDDGSSLNDDPTVAFQNGEAASIYRDRITNVNGLRTYTVTVMMLVDGSPLVVDGSDNVVNSFQAWARYGKPGEVEVGGDGVVATPGNERYVKALVQEVLSTAGSIADDYKPFSVKNWASVNVSYIPEDGSPVVSSKGAAGYLGNSTYAGTNSVFAGIPVDSVVASAVSSPTPAAFSALDNQVIDSANGPSFITDTGQRWYRRRKVTVVGTFGTYLDA